MTRRELFALAAGAALVRAADAPAPPVAIARCASYDDNLSSILSTMFDQIGGLPRLVANKTVTIKLNLTGSPALRVGGRPLGETHYSHPKTVGAMIDLMGRAGATRVRLVESCWGTAGPLEEYLLDSGWNVRSLQTAAKRVEFENTNALGKYKKYVRLPAAGGGYIYPTFELNQAFAETDVFVSMAKLKNHATCGVTLSMKNCFGNTPASIYGDDAGLDAPNENPTKGRVNVCHFGKRQPSKIALPERDTSFSREPETRMPRVSVDIASARPINIAFIDGVQTIAAGEGPWIRGVRPLHPGILILGTNGVTTDSVATAVMGYDPRAKRGTPPFSKCDNMLALAEARGLGSTDLSRIEVRGLPIAQARFPFQNA
jgi:uncharacterized protein (DUF362 family)